MKTYDVHVHSFVPEMDPEELLKNMNDAGVYGGAIFSQPPKLYGEHIGALFAEGRPFEERLNNIIRWTKGYEDRLFPVLWIHPDEENIIENIAVAKKAGICGFKIICNDFYVYEDKSINLLKEIAKNNLPVFFHSGILWDGGVSSKYNRPINWENLLNIEGLKFSLAHCSWPFIDECIALYGKFLSALKNMKTSEMFFDTTPGTPEIYRKELLTKLYTLGYDVSRNVMYGSDSRVHNYNGEWVKGWIDFDRGILNELGISKENQERLYYKNLLRFLGKEHLLSEEEVPKQNVPYSPYSSEVNGIIRKWYKKLDFDSFFDEEFEQALETIKISDAINVDNYNFDSTDGKRNLLSMLYMCEELAEKYKKAGIPEEILLDTLSDIRYWCNIWSDIKGELYLGEIKHLRLYLSFKLFKIGRLQYCIGNSTHDIPEADVRIGDTVLQVHIPEGGAISPEACQKSMDAAKEFFDKYFPDINWKCFTLHSWLLDENLEEMLPPESNIVKFAGMFTRISSEKSDSIIRYVFGWNSKRFGVKKYSANSTLQKKVKEKVLNGEDFYETFGYRI